TVDPHLVFAGHDLEVDLLGNDVLDGPVDAEPGHEIDRARHARGQHAAGVAGRRTHAIAWHLAGGDLAELRAADFGHVLVLVELACDQPQAHRGSGRGGDAIHQYRFEAPRAGRLRDEIDHGRRQFVHAVQPVAADAAVGLDVD